jgi:hypothetical protein
MAVAEWLTSREAVPTVMGWSRLVAGACGFSKLNEFKGLQRNCSARGSGRRTRRADRLEAGRPARLWPARLAGLRRHVTGALLCIILTALGCGATAPCPTPTTELDQLRTTSERLESELEEATRSEEVSREEREEQLRRLTEAQAALDSIADARGR